MIKAAAAAKKNPTDPLGANEAEIGKTTNTQNEEDKKSPEAGKIEKEGQGATTTPPSKSNQITQAEDVTSRKAYTGPHEEKGNNTVKDKHEVNEPSTPPQHQGGEEIKEENETKTDKEQTDPTKSPRHHKKGDNDRKTQPQPGGREGREGESKTTTGGQQTDQTASLGSDEDSESQNSSMDVTMGSDSEVEVISPRNNQDESWGSYSDTETESKIRTVELTSPPIRVARRTRGVQSEEEEEGAEWNTVDRSKKTNKQQRKNRDGPHQGSLFSEFKNHPLRLPDGLERVGGGKGGPVLLPLPARR